MKVITTFLATMMTIAAMATFLRFYYTDITLSFFDDCSGLIRHIELDNCILEMDKSGQIALVVTLVLGVAVTVLTYCCCRKRSERKKKDEENEQYEQIALVEINPPIASQKHYESPFLSNMHVPFLGAKVAPNQGPIKSARGLRNLGNTCYFNSTMQALTHTDFVFREELQYLHIKGKFVQNFLEFYEAMQSRDSSCYSPSSLHRMFGKKTPRFANRRQHDSHECLRNFLDNIRKEESANSGVADKQKVLTVVDKVFGGHFITVYICKKCETPYHVIEALLDISLPIMIDEKDSAVTNSSLFNNRNKTNSVKAQPEESRMKDHGSRKGDVEAKPSNPLEDSKVDATSENNRPTEDPDENVASTPKPEEMYKEAVEMLPNDGTHCSETEKRLEKKPDESDHETERNLSVEAEQLPETDATVPKHPIHQEHKDLAGSLCNDLETDSQALTEQNSEKSVLHRSLLDNSLNPDNKGHLLADKDETEYDMCEEIDTRDKQIKQEEQDPQVTEVDKKQHDEHASQITEVDHIQRDNQIPPFTEIDQKQQDEQVPLNSRIDQKQQNEQVPQVTEVDQKQQDGQVPQDKRVDQKQQDEQVPLNAGVDQKQQDEQVRLTIEVDKKQHDEQVRLTIEVDKKQHDEHASQITKVDKKQQDETSPQVTEVDQKQQDEQASQITELDKEHPPTSKQPDGQPAKVLEQDEERQKTQEQQDVQHHLNIEIEKQFKDSDEQQDEQYNREIELGEVREDKGHETEGQGQEVGQQTQRLRKVAHKDDDDDEGRDKMDFHDDKQGQKHEQEKEQEERKIDEQAQEKEEIDEGQQEKDKKEEVGEEEDYKEEGEQQQEQQQEGKGGEGKGYNKENDEEDKAECKASKEDEEQIQGHEQEVQEFKEKQHSLEPSDRYRQAIEKLMTPLVSYLQSPPTYETAKKTVDKCLRYLTRKEHIKDEYLCNDCCSKYMENGGTDIVLTSATKQTLIYNPPAVLTLHLKRFELKPGGSVKRTDMITYGEYLDIAPYCSSMCLRNDPRSRNIWYSLYGVVVHHGSTLKSGHYVAFVKVREKDAGLRKFLQKKCFDRDLTKEQVIEMMQEGQPEMMKGSHPEGTYVPLDRTWYCMNDESSRKVSVEEVLNQRAYLLFYERMS